MLGRCLALACIGLLIFGDGATLGALSQAATDSARAAGDVAAASALLVATTANVTATVVRGGVEALTTTQNA